MINDARGRGLLVSSVGSVDPLVVTLVLDETSAARFDAERRALFPPGRTAVGAHVTLFHAVPGELVDTVLADVGAVAARDPFPVPVTEVMSLGRGAAYRLAAPALVEVHRTLQRSWWDHLTAQDQQGFRAHVTVQNKVTPAEAQRTVQRLRELFTPFDATATGLAVWRYVGGPWEPVRTVSFEPGGAG